MKRHVCGIAALCALLAAIPVSAEPVTKAAVTRAQEEMLARVSAAVERYVHEIGIDPDYVAYCDADMYLRSFNHPQNGFIPFGVNYNQITDSEYLKQVLSAREAYERSFLILCLANAKRALSEAKAPFPLTEKEGVREFAQTMREFRPAQKELLDNETKATDERQGATRNGLLQKALQLQRERRLNEIQKLQAEIAATLWGRVVGVADGDTLTVLDQKHEKHDVRLSGIDAPEKSQAFAQRAKQSLSDLVYGRSVSVEWRKQDRYRRIVGKVSEGGRDVNLEQVRRGLAWHYKRYQSEQPALDRVRYANVETEARTARRGLWALPEAQRVPPWQWRHSGKQTAQAAPTERTAPGLACGSKRYCREMVSCEEARHYLSACGFTRLDGDSDGVPCEALC